MTKKAAGGAGRAEADEYTLKTVMTIQQIMRNMRSAGIQMPTEVEMSYPQMVALFALFDTGPVTMGELSQWLKVSHGVATRLVDRLVEKGMVERHRDDADRRVVIAGLSGEGQEYARQVIAFHLEKISKAFEEVAPEKLEVFMELLEQVNRYLEE
jgi:DNA-binding MarR family transcriptional regulator